MNKYEIQAIDALALYESLKRKKTEWVAFVKDPHGSQVFPHTPEWKEAKCLMFSMEIDAINEMGDHVGYNIFTGIMPLFKKEEFNIGSIPYAISPFIVFPETIDIYENIPNNEAFIQVENESAYEALEWVLGYAIEDLPDYEFIPQEGRLVWKLGDLECDLEEIAKKSS